MKSIRRHLTYANIAATLALALALGGTGAYAATLITSRMIKNGTIQNIDIHNNAIRSNKIHNGTIRTADLSAAARSGYYTASNTSDSSLNDVSGNDVKVLSLSVVNAGTYLVMAHTTIYDSDSTVGLMVPCKIVADSSTVDMATTAVEADSSSSYQAFFQAVSLQGVHTFTANDPVELWCAGANLALFARDTTITAVKIPQ